MNTRTKFWIAVVIALGLDIVDFFGAWIPIIGDVLDIVGVGILFYLTGPTALLGLLELIPLVDFLPTFTAAIFLSRFSIFTKIQNLLGGIQDDSDR